MQFVRAVWVLLLLLGISRCGKNEGVRPVGYYPGYGYPQAPLQAPPPYGGGYAPPSGYQPTSGYQPNLPYGGSYPGSQNFGPYGGSGNPYGYPGYFSPQFPAGQPNAFYPFLPLNQYMNRYPQFRIDWNHLWNGWQNYSQRSGCGLYDFSCFWLDYCPRTMSPTFAPIYQYFNTNVYFWLTPDTTFTSHADPAYFWEAYEWMPYEDIDLQVCGGTCL